MPLRTFSDWVSRNCFAAVVALGAFLSPIRPLMIAVGALVALDGVTGLCASLREKKRITSHRLFDSVVKVMVYQCCVITGLILEAHLFGGQVPAAKMIGAVIVAVEAKSILENGERIAGAPIFRTIRERLKTRGGRDK
jgi:hypothetical protein